MKPCEMEELLKNINATKVRLDEDKKRKHNQMLSQIREDVIVELKKDPILNSFYQDIYYAGSYWVNLKINSPDEYDLDIVLIFPKLSKPQLIPSSPGYVEVQFANLKEYEIQPYAVPFSTKLVRDGKISSKTIRGWFEGIVQKAVNKLNMNHMYSVCMGPKTKYSIAMKKGGPAITLTVSNEQYMFDVDLVPCFAFKQDQWPMGYKKLQNNSGNFLIVPKCTKNNEHNWRLSFDEQEKQILYNVQRVKPALRLLKLLRDQFNHDLIKSYYIKTIFLWEIDSFKDRVDYMTLYETFIMMLKSLQSHIDDGKILYFWNDDFNLLEENVVYYINLSNQLKRIIKTIETSSDAAKICEYFGMSISETNAGKSISETNAGKSISETNADEAPESDQLVETPTSFGWGWLVAAGVGVGAAALFAATALNRKKSNK